MEPKKKVEWETKILKFKIDAMTNLMLYCPDFSKT